VPAPGSIARRGIARAAVSVVAIVLLAAAAAAAEAAEPKALLMGIAPMNELPATPLPPADGRPPVDHVARSVYWSDVEPADQTFDWSAVDAALAANGGTRVRLRILAGIRSPDWLKRRFGSNTLCPAPSGGVYIEAPFDGEAGCVPRFWRDAYLAEYRELMTAVAKRYEPVDDLLDVVNSACGTVWAEPFALAAHRASNQRLWAAGLNKRTSEYCLDRSIAIHAQVFERTRTSLALARTWSWPNGAARGTGITSSWPELRRLANEYRAKLGSRLVLQYNALDAASTCADGMPTGSAVAPNVYCYLRGAAQPKGFQLRRYGRLVANCGGVASTSEECFAAAVENAQRLGGIFVEPHSEPDPAVAEPVTYLDFDRAWLTARDAELEQAALAAGAGPG
jgi:hypothetical protein